MSNIQKIYEKQQNNKALLIIRDNVGQRRKRTPQICGNEKINL